MSNWPRLSQTLTGPKSPDRCQSCGCNGNKDFTRWIEHDEDDRPETIVVVLCKPCADRIIEPHPRLYHSLPRFEPFPGAMSVCLDCAFREGVTCKCPKAQINGGPGLKYEQPEPTTAHVDYSDKKGRRCGRWMRMYEGPVTACSGKEAAKTNETALVP